MPTITSFGVRVEARLLEDVRAHREVREPVAAGVRAIRADSTDLGREVEDELGAGVVEQPRRVVHRGEVVVGAARDDDVVTVGLEPLDEVRAEEASAAGDQDTHPEQATSRLGAPTDERLRPRSGWAACAAAEESGRSGCRPLTARSAAFASGAVLAVLAVVAVRNALHVPARSAGTTRRSTSRMPTTSSIVACCRRTAIGVYYTPPGFMAVAGVAGQSRRALCTCTTRIIWGSSSAPSRSS